VPAHQCITQNDDGLFPGTSDNGQISELKVCTRDLTYRWSKGQIRWAADTGTFFQGFTSAQAAIAAK